MTITATEKAERIARLEPEDRALAETFKDKTLLVIPHNDVWDARDGIELDTFDDEEIAAADALRSVTQMLALTDPDANAMECLNTLLDTRDRDGYRRGYLEGSAAVGAKLCALAKDPKFVPGVTLVKDADDDAASVTTPDADMPSDEEGAAASDDESIEPRAACTVTEDQVDQLLGLDITHEHPDVAEVHSAQRRRDDSLGSFYFQLAEAGVSAHSINVQPALNAVAEHGYLRGLRDGRLRMIAIAGGLCMFEDNC